MCEQTRFLTLLGLLLIGGAVNAHAQVMGQIIPQNNEGPRPNNSIVGQMAGADGAAGVLEATPRHWKDFSTAPGKPSAAKQFSLDGMAEGVEVTAPEGFEMSLRQADGYSSSLRVEHLPATIWVRLTGSKPNVAKSMVHGDIIMSGHAETRGNITVKVYLEGTVK